MAKKTVKVGLKSAGSEPASGDVNISYKGSRIAGLSESCTAVLSTENTIVEDDIEVEYTKPASGITPKGFSLTLNPTTLGSSIIDDTGKKGGFLIVNEEYNTCMYCPSFSNAYASNINAYAPEMLTGGAGFGIYLTISRRTDDLLVTVNGDTIPFNSNDGWYEIYVHNTSYAALPDIAIEVTRNQT